MEPDTTYVAFAGVRQVAAGALREVLPVLRFPVTFVPL
jgi:hypothetical protein